MPDLLLTYYGDDFTGSTDVLEALVTGGVPTVLFLEPPTRAFLDAHFPNVRAVGVAGISRSMTPAQMDAELLPQFATLQALGAPLAHYKVCSTFDSLPTMGSIGHAIELGWAVFAPRFVPLLVGVPALKRYVVFSTLFAAFGDETYRIDRHPTMSKHPITPMDEGDLRLHLGKQTTRWISAIHIRQMDDPHTPLELSLEEEIEGGSEIVLFDTLNDAHLLQLGGLLWDMREAGVPFVVGSSGVEYALCAHWQAAGVVQKPQISAAAGEVDQLLVITGSAAPQTAAQIQHAIANGFTPIRLDSAALVGDEAEAGAARDAAIEEAETVISGGGSPLLFSTIGSDDPAIAAVNRRMSALGLPPKQVGARLGAQQGIILRTLLEKTGLRRVCVGGGDTCGHAARQLSIYALEFVTSIAPGAPLCRARSHQPHFDGLQIALKGGQNGGADYFSAIRRGST